MVGVYFSNSTRDSRVKLPSVQKSDSFGSQLGIYWTVFKVFY